MKFFSLFAHHAVPASITAERQVNFVESCRAIMMNYGMIWNNCFLHAPLVIQGICNSLELRRVLEVIKPATRTIMVEVKASYRMPSCGKLTLAMIHHNLRSAMTV